MKMMEAQHRDVVEIQREVLETVAGWNMRNFTWAVVSAEEFNRG